MRERLQGVYYRTSNGTCPVEEWLNKQSDKVQAKMFKYMEHLETYWDQGGFTFIRSLGDGLFEIKTKVDDKWPRLIYFYYDKGRIVYLHGFLKKQNRTPRREIDIAKRRRNDFCKQEENRQ